MAKNFNTVNGGGCMMNLGDEKVKSKTEGGGTVL